MQIHEALKKKLLLFFGVLREGIAM
jgi:hypothetical protein